MVLFIEFSLFTSFSKGVGRLGKWYGTKRQIKLYPLSKEACHATSHYMCLQLFTAIGTAPLLIGYLISLHIHCINHVKNRYWTYYLASSTLLNSSAALNLEELS